MKNFILLALSVASAMLSVVAGAPAVSSVHVSFVSGNKATQYSHGSGGDGKLVQYNLLGNEFGSLGNFGSTGAGTQRQSYSNNRNPEALAPEGVFLSPLPTEAAHSHSHYVENDPYLADPDTAKYAAQHPPFFSEFPHKRTVLALNERREDNGLEPNILRSIRPFFPFFEANNRGHVIHGHGHAAPALYPVRQHHYTAPYTPSYFFDDLEPTIIYYAEQQHILPRVDDDPWSIFTVKK